MSTSRQRVHPRLRLIQGPEMDEEPIFASAGLAASSGGGNWAALPSQILLQILKRLLVFTAFSSHNQDRESATYNRPVPPYRSKVVHCISRLDAFCRPKARPLDPANKLRLFHRFHVGTKEISLSDAEHPQSLLNVLGVCKRWCYLGSILFYSRNVFAFSSLGE